MKNTWLLVLAAAFISCAGVSGKQDTGGNDERQAAAQIQTAAAADETIPETETAASAETVQPELVPPELASPELIPPELAPFEIFVKATLPAPVSFALPEPEFPAFASVQTAQEPVPAPVQTPLPVQRQPMPGLAVTPLSPPVSQTAPVLPPETEPPEPAPPEPVPVDEEQPAAPLLPNNFSRMARATVGQMVEVPFNGTGWVFLGETGARRGIAYDSRRLDPEGETFIFRIEAAGVYSLKFNRQDFKRDSIINDYVQIIAGDSPESAGSGWFGPSIDRGRVIAGPRWPLDTELGARISEREIAPVPPAPVSPPPPSRQPATPAARPQTRPPVSGGDEGVSQVKAPALSGEGAGKAPSAAAPELPASVSPENLLQKAAEEFNAERIGSAISLLDQFRQLYPSGSDEAWWLYGQSYEANRPSRNILLALDYYRRLIREYPQSSRASDARRRISYLERYYINIP